VENEREVGEPGVGYYPASQNRNNPMSVRQWLGTLCLLMIPVANIILLFVWAFSEDTNTHKKNFSKAYLIVMVIAFVLTFILSFVIGLGLAAVGADMSGY
jgi:heme/copper-type cytochrome/quinol oxidase subunit 2